MIAEALEQATKIGEEIPAENGVIDKNRSMRRRTVWKSLTSKSETTLAVVALGEGKATNPGVVTSLSLYQIVIGFWTRLLFPGIFWD